jgi:hypothetical protein
MNGSPAGSSGDRGRVAHFGAGSGGMSVNFRIISTGYGDVIVRFFRPFLPQEGVRVLATRTPSEPRIGARFSPAGIRIRRLCGIQWSQPGSIQC